MMTQQEQELLKGLTDRVNNTSLASKDVEAERTLQAALGSNPDALYILCQTVLVQQFAMSNAQQQLTAARAEIDRLQQMAKPQEHGSFLGNLFGLGKSDDSQQQAERTTQVQPTGTGYSPVHAPVAPPVGYPQTQQSSYGTPPPYGTGYSQPTYGSAPGGMFGGGGGFLQGAMQTAAGVVAGEFAFRALEDVFHGGGEGRGFGGGAEVVNNYYGDDDSRNADSGFGDRLRDADGFNGSVSPDIEDRRGDAQGFVGGATNDNSFNATDDSNMSGSDGFSDNNSNDFGGGFDGGGGDDGNNY